MLRPDDLTLMAYADGELDAESEAEVELALAVDPESQARLDDILQSSQLVRAALDRPLHQQVPEHLIEGILAHGEGPADGVEPDSSPTDTTESNVIPFNRPAPAPRTRFAWAAAAAVAALVFGFAGGQVLPGFGGPGTQLATNEPVLRQAINQALETLPNGRAAPVMLAKDAFGSVTPVRTFITGDGQFCRDYVVLIGDGEGYQEHIASACRHGAGDWRREAANLGDV